MFPDPDYFYMENTSGNTATFTVYKTGTPASTDLSYSIDKVTWTDIHNGGNISNVTSGSKVYFRSSTGFSAGRYDTLRFDSNYQFDAGGHISTLLNYTDINSINSLGSYSFTSMFDSSKIVHANIDFYGIKNIGQNSLYQFFKNCTSLVSIPDFSSIETVGVSGFAYTFEACSSLQTPADVSNVTSVDSSGFTATYSACTSLADAIAPNVSTWNTTSFTNWLVNTASTGVVRKPAGLTIPTDNASGVPTGWTTENY